MKTRILVIVFALLAGAAAAHAQDGRLERVQNLIATGRLTEARNTLTQWERDNGDPRSSATSDERARALYLTGLLSTDAKAAEDAFIGVVLSYPSSPVAPEALLRLGQGLYTAGEHDRAITYLERLRSDYPRSPQRETGMLWLTRAQLAQGDAALACGTARETLFGSVNENVRTLVELERDRACQASGGVATNSSDRTSPRRRDSDPVRALDGNPTLRTGGAPPASGDPRAGAAVVREPVARDVQPGTTEARAAAAPPPAQRANSLPDLGIAVDDNMREPQRPRPERSTDARANDTSATDARTTDPRTAAARTRDMRAGDTARRADETDTRAETTPVNAPEYAVQTAAFRERRPAETIAAELRAKGFEARIVQVPGSPYFRVRYGAFMTSRDAAAASLRIRDAGFATLIVNDVRLERRP